MPASVDEAAIDALVADGDLIREGGWVYRAHTAELEAELAAQVLAGSTRTEPARRDDSGALDGADGGAGLGAGAVSRR